MPFLLTRGAIWLVLDQKMFKWRTNKHDFNVVIDFLKLALINDVKVRVLVSTRTKLTKPQHQSIHITQTALSKTFKLEHIQLWSPGICMELFKFFTLILFSVFCDQNESGFFYGSSQNRLLWIKFQARQFEKFYLITLLYGAFTIFSLSSFKL